MCVTIKHIINFVTLILQNNEYMQSGRTSFRPNWKDGND